MKALTRMKDIVASNVNAVLDRVEGSGKAGPIDGSRDGGFAGQNADHLLRSGSRTETLEGYCAR